MKKALLLIMTLVTISTQARAANLLQVYEQAITSDPVYQENIAKALATGEGVYISLASLLPSITGSYAPYLSDETSSGPAAVLTGDHTTRGYNMQLNATQTLFNYAQFTNFAQSRATAKQACATLNFAAQDLMIRVAKAYFQVLEDVDILKAALSTRAAYAKQLDQVNQQYKVGIKTITDVYTAQASYEMSDADYITSLNTLENDRENLRVITGHLYPTLSSLSEEFPLVQPNPSNINTWVDTATRQNWQIKAAQFGAQAAKINIAQQEAGHLPIVNVQGTYAVQFSDDFGSTKKDALSLPGSAQFHIATATLNLNLPLVQGGLVLAQTRQAKDNYRLASQQLEEQFRTTVNVTRQSFLNVIALIAKLSADKKAIQSSISSLEGMEAGYRVGTEILVNVLNQQQQVFNNQRVYAHDRYAYINNLLALKEAAGTLSPDDLAAINCRLGKAIDLDNEFPSKVRKMIEGSPVPANRGCSTQACGNMQAMNQKYVHSAKATPSAKYKKTSVQTKRKKIYKS